ncbi:MAG: hypothetical protein WB471_02055, partial [Nocardioides sp.]
MTWLGLLLIGIGTSDLAFSWIRRPRLAEGSAAALVAVLGLLAGVSGPGDVLGLLLVVLGVIGWGEAVTRSFGRGQFALPLVVLGAELGLAVLASTAGAPEGGIVSDWLIESTLPLVAGLSADRALLL